MPRQTLQRAAGILLPVFSLPSPYGIGTFGEAAYRWVDALQETGQTYWQVLPLGPTSYGDSPYQSVSAFAGNPYYIDLELLCQNGLLLKCECEEPNWGFDPPLVDYSALFAHREALLRRAYARFDDQAALARFRAQNKHWLEDYSLYMAAKTRMGLRAWSEWDNDIRLRKPVALSRLREAANEDIGYHCFVQYLFFKQWFALKSYANARGVSIIGDIPIYVSMDSADTWAGSHCFDLDESLRPRDVAGVPPDGFSSTGQLWGNPLYRWDILRKDGYRWWIDRLSANLALYDLLRIDHFRGFESYYAVPAAHTTAAHGVWKKGPGMDLFHAVQSALGSDLRIIAEDLGYVTAEVRALLEQSGFPGMKILQFAFDSREDSDYMPHNYDRHCVVYTGTHDNDTVQGWFAGAPSEDVALARDYLGLTDNRDGHWSFIRAALSSVAALAVIPLQDYLGLGPEARINTPSTVGGRNWRWRMSPHSMTPDLKKHILQWTKLYGRYRHSQGETV